MRKYELIGDTAKMVLMLIIVVIIASYTLYKQRTNTDNVAAGTQKVKAD